MTGMLNVENVMCSTYGGKVITTVQVERKDGVHAHGSDFLPGLFPGSTVGGW